NNKIVIARSPTRRRNGGTIGPYLVVASGALDSLSGAFPSSDSFPSSDPSAFLAFSTFGAFMVSSQAARFFSSESVPRNFFGWSSPSSFSFLDRKSTTQSAFFSRPTLERSGGFFFVVSSPSTAFLAIPAASMEWHELHLYLRKVGFPSGPFPAQETPLR